MMRIIVVISRLCYGGAEHVGVMLANGLARYGNEVIIASNSHERISYPVDERVGYYGVFPVTRNKLKKWAGATINLRKLIKREQTDVVVGIAETCSLIAKVACLGMRIPVVYTAHNSFERPSSAPMSKWNRFAKFKLGCMYSCVTVLTEADKSYIGKRLERVSVMPNPLELSPVKVIPDKERVIFAAGRLDAWHVKGFDVLIKAFSKLVQGLRFKVQGPMQPSSEELIANSGGWKLQIAGTGSEESLNYLKGLCKENGVEDSVEFLGFQKDIEKLYQKASIFVLSSRYEGFGLVLIEAMSQGCACIACDYKGRQREIIQNDSQGLCCEPDDVDALAEAMRKMMTDDDYRESVRMKAVERSEFYSLENTTRRWEELLEKVVKKGVS
jgi:glycosyltransferase involved in cell wall biosynthesis